MLRARIVALEQSVERNTFNALLGGLDDATSSIGSLLRLD